MTRAGLAVGALAIAAATLALPRLAHAGSCGGSGGSSGGSSDGSGDGSSSSDSSSSDSYSDSSSHVYLSTLSTESPPCVETSEIHGRRQCGEFGTWAMGRVPHLAIELGTSVRSISLARLDLSGRIDHEDDGSYAYRMTGAPDAGAAAAVGADLRVTGGRRWYGGVELSIGGIAADPGAMEMSFAAEPGASGEAALQLHVAGGAVAGARWSLGRLSVAGEVFAGARMLQVEIESRYGYCDLTDHARDYSVAVEPRARADLWLSPWATVGAFAGTDIAQPGSRVLGVYVGGHTRAFDGVR